MPSLFRRKASDGMVHDEFVSGPIGPAGERSLVTGEIIRNIGVDYATEKDKVAHFGVGVRTPAEQLHFDMFVHKDLFGPVHREIRMFSDLASSFAFDDEDALPLPERITPLGRGVSMAQAPDIPGYVELASTVFDHLGANATDYDLYRIRMAYPPMPVTVMMKHELLPREGAG